MPIPMKQPNVPALLRKWQRRNGLSPVEASERLRVNRRTYYDWLAGKHAPRGVALTWLLNKIGK